MHTVKSQGKENLAPMSEELNTILAEIVVKNRMLYVRNIFELAPRLI